MRQRFSSIPMAVLGILGGLCVQPLVAQAPQSPVPQAQNQTPGQAQQTPELKSSPTKVLQDFEPPADAEYQLGAGDEISLDFPGKPDLATKRIIGPDGRITIPLAGSLKVADLTRSQASTLIANSLAPYYKDLTVTVDVEKYGSNRVIVLGNVKNPGVLYFDSTPTLLDAIARGGLMANAPSNGTPALGGNHDGIPERCAIYRGNDTVVWVDLRALLRGGSTMADIRLKRNDVVFVPAQQELFVSVLGAVQHPGAIPLTSDSTLASVIAQAGGQADGSGRNIHIYQPSTGKTITVPFKDLMSPKAVEEVSLHSGDVILVPKSTLFKATYLLDKISPIASVATFAAIY